MAWRKRCCCAVTLVGKNRFFRKRSAVPAKAMVPAMCRRRRRRPLSSSRQMGARTGQYGDAPARRRGRRRLAKCRRRLEVHFPARRETSFMSDSPTIPSPRRHSRPKPSGASLPLLDDLPPFSFYGPATFPPMALCQRCRRLPAREAQPKCGGHKRQLHGVAARRRRSWIASQASVSGGKDTTMRSRPAESSSCKAAYNPCA